MFKNIKEYIKLSKEERSNHIRLSEKCIEIGGINSTVYKGLLAHYLKTTIPDREKIFLCHACNNPKCSNVNHLYWGTPKENMEDFIELGTYITPRELTIKKYGEKEANEIFKNASSKGGKKGGGSNKLTSDEIEKRLSLISDIDLNCYGANSKIAKRLNITHTQARRFINKYLRSSIG